MSALILDTDPGVDDAMAIAFACAHPQIDLLALTTVFGNVSVGQATRNALTLLEQFDHSEIAVATGAAQPLIQDPLPFPEFVHGSDGLGNIHLPDPVGSAIELSAAEFIVQQCAARPGDITLVAVGPLTNIALALRLDLLLPTRVKQLVVMGGTLHEAGNVSPVAEANFLADPHAADEVFAVTWPATIVGLDVTHRVMLQASDLGSIGKGSKRYGETLHAASAFYMDYYNSTAVGQQNSEPACAMHDATALVYLLQPELFTTETGPVRIVCDGIGRGQLTMARKGYRYLLTDWQDRGDTTACVGVSAESVKRLFINTLLT